MSKMKVNGWEKNRCVPVYLIRAVKHWTCCRLIKGVVHPKIKFVIIYSLKLSQTLINFFLVLKTKEDIYNMWVTKQLLVSTDW